MKYIAYAFLALASLCSTPKKNTETDFKKATEKKITKPVVSQNELIVVLKNANNIKEVKELVKNSGLTWSKMAYETDSYKIGIVEVPEGKREFWINKLQESGEFSLVDNNSEEKLTKLISENNNNLITLKKTQCFGDCPIYAVTIDKNGNVVYKGIEYVLKKGTKKFTLSNKQLQELTDKLDNANFASFKTVYDNPDVLDLGSTYITYNGKQVQIRLWKNIPDALIDINEYIADILFEKKFIE